jgi:hypothetical protein
VARTNRKSLFRFQSVTPARYREQVAPEALRDYKSRVFRALSSLVAAGVGMAAFGAFTIAVAVALGWVLFFAALFVLGALGAMFG